MTTPDTSEVRAWARSNGYDVADRGRLPAELTEAYLAAQGKGATASKKAAPAKKKAAATKAAPAKRTAAKKPAAKAPAMKATPAPAARAVEVPPSEVRPATASKPEPQPKPSPVTDDRRLVALAEQLATLTDRVAALEKAGGSTGSNGKPAGKRFRRSR